MNEKLINELKKVINRYYQYDPWSQKDNPDCDMDYSAEEAMDDIVDVISDFAIKERIAL